MSPLVSIIMPAFNVGTFISDAIGSVLKQTYQNWELIIIDNGSTDETFTLASNFNDARIKILSEKKQGTSYARNRGLFESKGEYTSFLDADDVLPERSIEMRVLSLMQHPDFVICDGKVVVYNENLSKAITDFQPVAPQDLNTEMALLVPSCFITVSWMIRSAAIKDVAFPIGWTHFEDRIFFGLVGRNSMYHCLQEDVYHFRKRRHSSMTNIAALDKSYQRFLSEIQPGILPKEVCEVERKKYHSIFFRTYLKRANLIKGLQHFMKMI